MLNEVRNRYEAKARTIKSLAHPTRLFLVDQLSQGERCVCELTALVGDDISTISKHLSVLKNAGVVQDEKRGSSIYYSLRISCILNFFKCADAVIEAINKEQNALT